MTHIDTYSHRIPHKYTQIHTFYTHLHTNCHIFGWVTKNHTYIYIYLYIYTTKTSFIDSNILPSFHRVTNNHYNIHSFKEKKFFNQKSKQIKSIHSFRSFIHS